MLSFDQLSAFMAYVETGTFQKASEKLNKSYTSVNYQIGLLEQTLKLQLLNRQGYKSELTPQGRALLDSVQKVLQSKEDLLRMCEELRNGWEPRLSLIYDGIINMKPVLAAVHAAKKLGFSTQITTHVSYHEEVENDFLRLAADFMISIAPTKEIEMPSSPLPAIKIFLVAGSDHELSRSHSKLSLDTLRKHTLVTVKGSSVRLGLSTLELERNNHFTVSDFAAKKYVILEGLGYGWLPEYLIEKELKNKKLKVLNSEIANEHLLRPRLYHRPLSKLGPCSRQLFKQLTAED